MKRKLLVVTATRAEYYLLKPLLEKIKLQEELELILVATGTHLSDCFGNTYKDIERDYFQINHKVYLDLKDDSRKSTAKALGEITVEMAKILEEELPDIVIILGDRYEMLGVSQSALLLNIPIAHLHGGELTLGAYDDAIRHSISKMSTWHFVSAEVHRQRLLQLGEEPYRVFNVGALGVDNILNEKENIGKPIIDGSYLLITYHPETNKQVDRLDQLLEALGEYKHYKLVITGANADSRGSSVNRKLKDFAQENENATFYMNLGANYLNVLAHAKVVVGNSSSGIIEAAYLSTPTVNCGDRQKGRLAPSSVYHCKMEKSDIIDAINLALVHELPYEYVFGNGQATTKIINTLKEINDYHVIKEFNDL